MTNNIIIFFASYLYLFVVLGILLAWLQTRKNLRLQFVVATVLAGVIALILSRIANKLYYDPRPFVTEHVKPLIAHVADNGFPSDHALLTMTLTAITYLYNRKVAAAMLVLTIVVGGSRILARVHSPLDIGTGWVIGIVGAVAGYYIAQYFWAKQKPKTQQ